MNLHSLIWMYVFWERETKTETQCVCVCVCVWEREREREGNSAGRYIIIKLDYFGKWSEIVLLLDFRSG